MVDVWMVDCVKLLRGFMNFFRGFELILEEFCCLGSRLVLMCVKVLG